MTGKAVDYRRTDFLADLDFAAGLDSDFFAAGFLAAVFLAVSFGFLCGLLQDSGFGGERPDRLAERNPAHLFCGRLRGSHSFRWHRGFALLDAMTHHGSRETSYDCARGPGDYAAGDRASHGTGGLFGEWDVRTRI